MIDMQKMFLLIILNIGGSFILYSQSSEPGSRQRKAIIFLIDQYSSAREKRDTTVLKTILTNDVDQLVSTGEWRIGIGTAVQGMLKSSANTPGTRTLTVDKIRMLDPATAIVDCKYDIQNADGTMRRMWSTFIVVNKKKVWKISAIRNMLPASQ
jgi:uncharacterized protein (TIGR02246 family)